MHENLSQSKKPQTLKTNTLTIMDMQLKNKKKHKMNKINTQQASQEDITCITIYSLQDAGVFMLRLITPGLSILPAIDLVSTRIVSSMVS